jgi:peptidoglycan/xylan/chitin deacetylase (PgdA/CDA1 family)
MLVEIAGGIWLRATAFPYPYRSAFNFRLDYDEYDADDFASVLSVVEQQPECFSHFICAASFENQPQALAQLKGGDVGSHGYWHHTYDDVLENRRNVTRGIATLRAHGIEPAGFAAPHGRFNRGLLSVLEELGVRHSSEFGLAYDELPFFPADSSVLQVPVHPICLGICLEAATESGGADGQALRSAADVLAEYFRWIATAKYQAGEPIFLYGHPERRLGRFPHVLRIVLETVSQFAAVWRTTLSEFTTWWRARSELQLRVYRVGDNFEIHVDQRPPGYRFGVEYWRGEHSAPMPIDEPIVQFSPSALVFQGRKPRDLPTLVRLDQPIGLRSQLLRYLDWEKVTPVEEIGTHHWRGWVKRTLRRIRD